MENKVVLITIDGMRPDGFLACNHPFAEEMMGCGTYSLTADTVFPPVTLPCHMSMFQSVRPERHGVTTNVYTPPVRPIKGLFEQIHDAGGVCAMYYGWEPLRDIARPESLTYASYIQALSADDTDGMLAQCALDRIEKSHPDFVFLHLVETDEKGGHDSGWMSQEYLGYIYNAIDHVQRMWQEIGGKYTFIITADHGGHDRDHGKDQKEDMMIPMFFMGQAFCQGQALFHVSLLDIAPTIADLLHICPAPEWEGMSLIRGQRI